MEAWTGEAPLPGQLLKGTKLLDTHEYIEPDVVQTQIQADTDSTKPLDDAVRPEVMVAPEAVLPEGNANAPVIPL
jgi:hypothetical protein